MRAAAQDKRLPSHSLQQAPAARCCSWACVAELRIPQPLAAAAASRERGVGVGGGEGACGAE